MDSWATGLGLLVKRANAQTADTGGLSHECVDLAQFYHDTDIAASELYSEIWDCKMLPTAVRSEILLKTSLELLNRGNGPPFRRAAIPGILGLGLGLGLGYC